MSDPSFIDIDQNNLDKEWIEQPGLFYKYACLLADAKKSLAEAKSNYDLIQAETAAEIRREPERFGLEKVTEAAITATIPLQTLVKKGSTDFIESRHTVDTLEAAVTALEHRKRALENLVSLHGQSYFSTPRATAENAKRMDEKVTENTMKAANARIKRNK